MLLLAACQSDEAGMASGSYTTPPAPADALFEPLNVKARGIDFENTLTYTAEFNPYTYRNYFNGGGVGLGDFNNDGWVDIYFTGNLADNRLYLNQGDLTFKDITDQAGVACPDVWSSGVAVADVNGDGWLDIYVCKSGAPDGQNRHNELFINQKDLTFKEQAAEYGIDDLGLSTHAAFFDYDRDGDLDMYLLNNSIRPVGQYDLIEGQRDIRDPEGGNKLYRNDGGQFTDVSEAANIYGSNIGFGLGVSVADLNNDGWPDIYVSNDFFERDYLYINQQDGTFEETLESHMREISMGAMGADIADLNNDGWQEVFVTDMLPEGERRVKTKTNFENWDKYRMNVEQGYYHQFTRNTLQLNNADGTFSEISRYAGVEATDWSWGALIFDANLDGRKDIFVANGILKDLTDQDYIDFYSDPAVVREVLKDRSKGIIKLVDAMPSEPIPNYFFEQHQALQFRNAAEEWGVGQPSFSNGSAYADLDNDGDQELVVNNVNAPPFLYKNRSVEQERGHWVGIELKGAKGNRDGLGARVTVITGQDTLWQEVNPIRGFQSSVDSRLIFGLGAATAADRIVVDWLGGQRSTKEKVRAGQYLAFNQSDASAEPGPAPPSPNHPLLIPKPASYTEDMLHLESQYSDFDRYRMLFHMVSAEGARLAVADVNGDGQEDVYLCGASGQPGQLFLGKASGGFQPSDQPAIRAQAIAEEVEARFFDADNDGDPDLYIATGTSELPNSSTGQRDLFYFNDRGRFRLTEQILPNGRFTATASVDAADFDQDGDIDLAVAERMRSFEYGVPVSLYLLENDGKGQFAEVGQARSSGSFQNLGLLRSVRWADLNEDGAPDLVVAREWGPLEVFLQQQGQFQPATAEWGLEELRGWWSCVEVADLDNDGDQDLVAGNYGLNSRLEADAKQPLRMYINDFDGNGTAEQLIEQYRGDTAYPITLKKDLVAQIPALKRKYLKNEQYQGERLSDIFPSEALQQSIVYEINEMQSMIFWNEGGRFKPQPLPWAVQLAPVCSIEATDLNDDGLMDLVMGGNFYRAKPELGIQDATYGHVLLGQSGQAFDYLPPRESGMRIKGEARSFVVVNNRGERVLLSSRNNDQVIAFKIKRK